MTRATGQGGDPLFNMMNLQLLGMVNALKTGDPTVDMLLAMIVPYFVTTFSKDLWRYLKKLFTPKVELPGPTFERTITHRSAFTSAGGQIDVDSDNYNLVLIKAILLYVHENCKLELNEADMNLTTKSSPKSRNTPAHLRNRDRYAASTTASAWLKTFEFVERPVSRQWLKVGKFAKHNVHIYMDDTMNKKDNDKDNGGGHKGVRDIIVKVRSNDKGSLHHFLKTAYDWYVGQLEDQECKDRFLLDLKQFENGSMPTYRRYKLGDDKTFESLFSQHCKSLLKIVDQFESKSGRYRIKGYPHKLGLLLTGPPGTGKTSLIKALAHYTNRHIVNVPLARINTNAELMGMLFNKKYQLDDTGAFTNLDFNKVIFVFEDVDASSDVVKDRKLVEEERRLRKEKEEEEKKDKMAAQRMALGGRYPPPSTVVTRSDALNLTGVLNVLDGVVETPGRMIIMSSNHPEILDEALIRPGRIDKILELGYMVAVDIIAMIKHYYETKLSEEQEERVRKLVDGGMELTAATLEQLTIEEETVDGLLSYLEEGSQGRRKRVRYSNTVSD